MQTNIVEFKENAECCEVKWDQVRKLMEFQGISVAELSRRSGTPESSMRKYLRGEVKDLRISSFVPIVRALNASADKLLGLAPERDFEREAENYDPTLMDNMRRYLDETIRASSEEYAKAQAQIAEQIGRIEYKAERIRDLEAENASLKAQLAARDATISNMQAAEKHREKMYRRLKWAVFGLVIVCVYFAIEFLRIDKGLTGMLYGDMLK